MFLRRVAAMCCNDLSPRVPPAFTNDFLNEFFACYSENENTVFASSLVLRLFHQALPFLKHDVHENVEGDVRISSYNGRPGKHRKNLT